MKISLILLSISLSLAATAQNYETVSLAKKELKLNNGSMYDGTNSAVLTLDIPPLTTYMYYTIDVGTKGGPQGLDLYGQVARYANQAQNFTVGEGDKVLPQLSIPQGDGSVDVYLVLDEGDVRLFNKRKKGWHYNEPYSRENVGSATVGIPVGVSAGPKLTYLCLRNPSMANAQYVNVEVVAVKQKTK